MNAGRGGSVDPDALDRAAKELAQIAQELSQVAGVFGVLHLKVGPVAGRVEQLVGGSATGKDKDVSQSLSGAAGYLKASADEAKIGSDRARNAAQQAAAEAVRARREQAVQQERSRASGERCRNSS